jgi:hypothetical protein
VVRAIGYVERESRYSMERKRGMFHLLSSFDRICLRLHLIKYLSFRLDSYVCGIVLVLLPRRPFLFFTAHQRIDPSEFDVVQVSSDGAGTLLDSERPSRLNRAVIVTVPAYPNVLQMQRQNAVRVSDSYGGLFHLERQLLNRTSKAYIAVYARGVFKSWESTATDHMHLLHMQ